MEQVYTKLWTHPPALMVSSNEFRCEAVTSNARTLLVSDVLVAVRSSARVVDHQ
jgi:hypothetical protein